MFGPAHFTADVLHMCSGTLLHEARLDHRKDRGPRGRAPIYRRRRGQTGPFATSAGRPNWSNSILHCGDSRFGGRISRTQGRPRKDSPRVRKPLPLRGLNFATPGSRKRYDVEPRSLCAALLCNGSGDVLQRSVLAAVRKFLQAKRLPGKKRANVSRCGRQSSSRRATGTSGSRGCRRTLRAGASSGKRKHEFSAKDIPIERRLGCGRPGVKGARSCGRKHTAAVCFFAKILIGGDESG